jgi:hypothetical protein
MEKKFKTDGAMKYVFLSTFAILVLLSVVAWRIQPENTATGKIPLVWVSDDNPARLEQALKFLLYLANRECHKLINHQADVLAPVNKYPIPKSTCTTPLSQRKTSTRYGGMR